MLPYLSFPQNVGAEVEHVMLRRWSDSLAVNHLPATKHLGWGVSSFLVLNASMNDSSARHGAPRNLKRGRPYALMPPLLPHALDSSLRSE